MTLNKRQRILKKFVAEKVVRPWPDRPERRLRPCAAAAVDRYLLVDGPTAANRQQRRAAAGCDRRTDGWTDARKFSSPAPIIMRVVPISKEK